MANRLLLLVIVAVGLEMLSAGVPRAQAGPDPSAAVVRNEALPTAAISTTRPGADATPAAASKAQAPPATSAPDAAAKSWPTSRPGDPLLVNVSGKFRFRMLADMKKVDHHEGVDSVNAMYANGTITLSFNYGPYSGPVVWEPAPNVKKAGVVVGGRHATLATYDFPRDKPAPIWYAGIDFPDIGGDKKFRLTVYARCTTAAAQQVATRVLQTISFP